MRTGTARGVFPGGEPGRKSRRPGIVALETTFQNGAVRIRVIGKNPFRLIRRQEPRQPGLPPIPGGEPGGPCLSAWADRSRSGRFRPAA